MRLRRPNLAERILASARWPHTTASRAYRLAIFVLDHGLNRSSAGYTRFVGLYLAAKRGPISSLGTGCNVDIHILR